MMNTISIRFFMGGGSQSSSLIVDSKILMSRVLYAVRLQAQQAQAIRAAQQAMAQVTWLRTLIWPGWRDANYIFPPFCPFR